MKLKTQWIEEEASLPLAGRVKKQTKINYENLFPQGEDDFNMDIYPLYHPAYIASAPAITRSGRRTKANPRLDL